MSESENLESSLDGKRALDWNEAEALIDSRLDLIEPEARMILKSMRIHDCQESFEALIEFFGSLELVEKGNTFDSAIKVLDTVYDAFDKIDVNHDQVISKEELEIYHDKRIEELKDGPQNYYELQNESSSLKWLVRHYGTLQFAKFLRWSRGMCKQDIEEAKSIFQGLKFLQENFDEVSETDENGEKEVSVDSLVNFIRNNRENYSNEEINPLEHLCVYVARIATNDSSHHGITFEGLSNLGPEQIWGERAEKLKDEKDIGSRQVD